jgi:hypothetical protein
MRRLYRYVCPFFDMFRIQIVWTDFDEIWYWSFTVRSCKWNFNDILNWRVLLKFVDVHQFWLKLDNNNGYVT